LSGAIHSRARKSIRISAPRTRSTNRMNGEEAKGIVATKNTTVPISKQISA
jgi:hypothetical protein